MIIFQAVSYNASFGIQVSPPTMCIKRWDCGCWLGPSSHSTCGSHRSASQRAWRWCSHCSSLPSCSSPSEPLLKARNAHRPVDTLAYSVHWPPGTVPRHPFSTQRTADNCSRWDTWWHRNRNRRDPFLYCVDAPEFIDCFEQPCGKLSLICLR